MKPSLSLQSLAPVPYLSLLLSPMTKSWSYLSSSLGIWQPEVVIVFPTYTLVLFKPQQTSLMIMVVIVSYVPSSSIKKTRQAHAGSIK